MEALADRAISRQAGFNSEYLYREIDRANEDVKQPMREAVIEHILKHHPDNGKMRCFGLPGERWAFENQLMEAWPMPSQFIGVEREIAILRRGISWMPGERPYWQEHRFSFGALHYVEATRSRIFYGEL